MRNDISLLTNVRSAIYYIYLPLSAIIVCLVAWPTLFKREWAWTVGQFWNRQAMLALKLICGLSYQIRSEAPLPTGGTLIAAKHQSMFETLALAASLEKPVFVLKKELLNVPIFGWFCRACGFIGIDRAGGAAAMRDMLELAQDRIREGHQVVIFPEGTRMQPGEKGTYHPGVAGIYRALNMPCIPVAHNSGVYWHNPGYIRQAGMITMDFLPEIPVGLKRAEFMKELERDIEAGSIALFRADPSQRPPAGTSHEQPVESKI